MGLSAFGTTPPDQFVGMLQEPSPPIHVVENSVPKAFEALTPVTSAAAQAANSRF